MSQKIAIDCDGVLANFTDAYAAAANKLYPGTFEEGFIPSNWNMDDRLTKEQDDKVWAAIKATPNFWLGLNAYSDNVGSLARWLATQKGREVYIVTSRVETEGYSVAKQTQLWLRACGVSELHNYVGVLPVTDSNKKAGVYRSADFGYSIDDKAETVEQCDAMKADHKAYLLDRQWNQHANVQRRVKSLDAFLKEIA